MRPRHKAAENPRRRDGPRRRVHVASMRPRHKAAENGEVELSERMLASIGFNEAAA